MHGGGKEIYKEEGTKLSRGFLEMHDAGGKEISKGKLSHVLAFFLDARRRPRSFKEEGFLAKSIGFLPRRCMAKRA
ncbi:hypothetical protein ACE6H2_027132 [Prunus campanulata]